MGLRRWWRRRLRYDGECPQCGHDWREHAPNAVDEGPCSECAYELEHVDADLTYLLLDETGEVRVYRSLEALVGDIESYDVADNLYTAWDISGRRIELLVDSADRFRVEARITTVDDHTQMRAALERWIGQAQQRHGRPPADAASLSTAALVYEAYRLQQPPPSLLQRLRRRCKRLP